MHPVDGQDADFVTCFESIFKIGAYRSPGNTPNLTVWDRSYGINGVAVAVHENTTGNVITMYTEGDVSNDWSKLRWKLNQLPVRMRATWYDRDVDEPIRPSVRPDIGPNIGFSFRHGWCSLALSTREESTELRASTLHDSFSRLVQGVNGLLTGNECVSIISGGEGQGCFIDMSIDANDNIGLVVHSMRNPRWLSPADSWMPVRGEVKFQDYSASNHFCRSYGRALRQVRTEYADATDYMEHWGWSFPVDEYLKFERHASRKGYRPTA